MRRNTIEDFFQLVDTKGGNTNVCWPWTGYTGGQYNDRGYFQYEGQKWLAYRLMYTLTNGEIPEGKVIRHKCNNSLCCNPNHLEAGTKSENENDKYLTDRAGLPVAVVREIKRLLQTSSMTQQKMAEWVSERYNYPVSRSAIRDIKLGLRRNQIDASKTSDEVIADQITVGEEDE